jgi:hypothetical protein
MAIAHDATGTFGTTPDTASPMEWTHTPVGIPRGVVVLIVAGTASDTITTVTYGGVAMARAVEGHVAGEAGSSYIYFLGSAIPTGPQTVSVVFTGVVEHMGCSVTVTANMDVKKWGVEAITFTPLTDPFVLSGITFPVPVLTYGALYSGLPGPASITPGANCTTIESVDFGTDCSSCLRRSAVVAPGNSVTISWTAANDDSCCVGIVLGEPTSPGSGWITKGGWF